MSASSSNFLAKVKGSHHSQLAHLQDHLSTLLTQRSSRPSAAQVVKNLEDNVRQQGRYQDKLGRLAHNMKVMQANHGTFITDVEVEAKPASLPSRLPSLPKLTIIVEDQDYRSMLSDVLRTQRQVKSSNEDLEGIKRCVSRTRNNLERHF
jgi:hypothetical protein